MKIWLNHILACPDDKTFPLHLKIFNWDTAEESFQQLMKAYQTKSLMNFKDEKNPFTIQVYDDRIFSEDDVTGLDDKIIHEENKRITRSLDFQNIINIFLEEDKILIKDYNMVSPDSIKGYLKYYLDFLSEFDAIFDESEMELGKKFLELVKTEIHERLKSFSQDFVELSPENLENKEEPNIIDNIMDKFRDVFQDVLFLNYILFIFEINEGILTCSSCNRWFPIIDTIPRLFPKNIKKTELDFDFKEKWSEKIPKESI